MLSISIAFHLSTKGTRGIIVGRAVHFRENRRIVHNAVPRKRSPPSGIGALLAATVVALTLKVFFADLAVVDGRSMEPFFSRGSVVLVVRCAYGLRTPGSSGTYWLRWGRPRPGDVVLAFPPESGKRVVKRVTAVGPARETSASSGKPQGASNAGLPAEEVFLLGDNPVESRDSREYGPVRIDRIAGKILRLRL